MLNYMFLMNSQRGRAIALNLIQIYKPTKLLCIAAMTMIKINFSQNGNKCHDWQRRERWSWERIVER